MRIKFDIKIKMTGHLVILIDQLESQGDEKEKRKEKK
jgi:hypothetical protein